MDRVKSFFVSRIEAFGQSILDNLHGLGEFTQYIMATTFWALKPPFRWKLLWEQMYFIGNKSLFIVCLTAGFTGMVFALQIYLGFTFMNIDSLIGPLVLISLSKELAPVFTGLVVAGRCGAAMAAQIGTMKVTEQVDALEVMGINGYQYLSVPRILAAMLSMPMLTAIFMLVGHFGSWFIGVKVLGIDDVIYTMKVGDFMKLGMIAEGLIKGFVFGYLIGIIGTYHGFKVEGGAEGVGRGTNMAVVWGMIIVLIVDFFLTNFLSKIL